MDYSRLVEMIFERKQLWDVRDKNYQNRDVTRKLWDEIATEMKCTSYVAKKKWTNMRDTYRKEYRKMLRSDNNSRVPHWRYFDKLGFLNEVINMRKTPTPSGNSYKQMKSRTQRSEDSISTNGANEDSLEYAEINPLSFLCQLPQLHMDGNAGDYETDATDEENGERKINDKSTATSAKKNPSTVRKHRPVHVANSRPSSMRSTAAENVHCETAVDEDYHFLMSLLPHMRDIPKQKKLLVRQKFLQTLLDEQEIEIISNSQWEHTESVNRFQNEIATSECSDIDMEAEKEKITVVKIEKCNPDQSPERQN